MRVLWLALTSIFLLFCACNVRNKGENLVWKEFVSDEGKFKATFPNVPQKSVSEIDWGYMKVPNYRFEVLSPIYFSVSYTDYPQPAGRNENELKYTYDYQRDLAIKLTDAELITERDVWLDGNLGREIVVKSKTFLFFNNQIVTYRFYSIGKRIYQLNTSFNAFFRDAEVEKNSIKFLDSFQLIEK